MLQACNQLELATHIEITASLLCKDAVAVIKTALAGTQTEHLINVLEAAFIGDEVKIETVAEGDTLDEEEVEDEDLEQIMENLEIKTPSTSTLSKALKHKLPPPTKERKQKASSHLSKGGVSTLKDATPLFPTTTHQGKHLHVSIDPKFISTCLSSKHSPKAGYCCMFSTVAKSEGKIVTDYEFFSTIKAQLSTHICKHHLGVAVTCFVCNRHWRSASSWFSHMEKVLSTLKEDDYFIHTNAKQKLLEFHDSKIVVKVEVSTTDV